MPVMDDIPGPNDGHPFPSLKGNTFFRDAFADQMAPEIKREKPGQEFKERGNVRKDNHSP